VVPDQLRPIRCSGAATIAALSKAKSFMTVNTSQIGQAIAGAILLTEDGSLRRLIAPAIGFYHANRDAMLEGLSASFKNYRDQVTWNSPEGGFFLTVRLPFAYGQEEAEVCAREYGVITMPLSFFALDDGYKEWVRLAFSNCTPDRILQGVDRFSEFVKMRLAMKMA
jgi:(S)-3,5-dihydroxyphenylglycine transaminase